MHDTAQEDGEQPNSDQTQKRKRKVPWHEKPHLTCTDLADLWDVSRRTAALRVERLGLTKIQLTPNKWVVPTGEVRAKIADVDTRGTPPKRPDITCPCCRVTLVCQTCGYGSPEPEPELTEAARQALVRQLAAEQWEDWRKTSPQTAPSVFRYEDYAKDIPTDDDEDEDDDWYEFDSSTMADLDAGIYVDVDDDAA